MKRFFQFSFVSSLLVLPLMVSAQIVGGNVDSFLQSIIMFINRTLIPFIWAIAFIVFIWGIFQYFILGGANEEARDKGKQLAVWGIVAFFIMSSLWGLVNLLLGTFPDFRQSPKNQ